MTPQKLLELNIKKWQNAKKTHDSLKPNRSETSPSISRVEDMIDSFDINYLRAMHHCEELLVEIAKPETRSWRNLEWDFGSSAFFTCVASWCAYWSHKKKAYILGEQVNVDDYQQLVAQFDKYKNVCKSFKRSQDAIEAWNERILRKPLIAEMKHICVDPYIILSITNEND